MTSQPCGVMATGATPGGVSRHFWDAVAAAASPQASVWKGAPPRDETASTAVATPSSLATAAISGTGLSTPVEVSLWTMARTRTRCARSHRRTSSGSAGCSQGTWRTSTWGV